LIGKVIEENDFEDKGINGRRIFERILLKGLMTV